MDAEAQAEAVELLGFLLRALVTIICLLLTSWVGGRPKDGEVKTSARS